MHERIAQIINALNLKRSDFAAGIGVTPSAISHLCSGNIEPSSRTISDICRVYSVNEAWLRTGVGEMFLPRSNKDEIAGFLGTILGGKATPYQEWLVSFLATTGPEEWKLLEAKTRELYESLHKFYED